MRKRQRFVVVNTFEEFLPKKSDFKIVEEFVPKLKANEFLVQTKFVSVDPYMRSFAGGIEVPYQQFGFQIGQVIESKNSQYPKNSQVVSHSGWTDFVILDGEPDSMFKFKPYIPNIGDLPLSLAVGALGMPGITAYLGLLEICRPNRGETVCVTSAAGAVGSLVGQIAIIKGCKVIGFTGSEKKVRLLKQELGFHSAINYKVDNVPEALKLAAPNGIDCFFDNVGGPLSAIIMEHMNELGRVALCGAISTYGESSIEQNRAKTHVSVRIESFSFTQWTWSKQSDALTQLKGLLEKGTIKAKETIVNGFQQLPDTFVAMLKGDYVGKAVVQL